MATLVRERVADLSDIRQRTAMDLQHQHRLAMTSISMRRPSPSMVVALTALVVAVGGTAMAATNLVNGDRLIRKSTPSAGTLASGKTLTGRFGLSGVAVSGGHRAETGISFAFPFASAPTTSVIAPGGTPTAQCPGSFTNPQAAPGNLCLYESNDVNVSLDCVYTGVSGCGVATQYGGVEFIESAMAGMFYAEGTWAATAP
jgi:hypothetical protein